MLAYTATINLEKGLSSQFLRAASRVGHNFIKYIKTYFKQIPFL